MIDILLAAPELPGEADLVSAAPGAGLRVVRRCLEAADLLAAAASDPRAWVVVSAGLPRLSSDVIGRLGQRVVGLAAGAADDLVLHGVGVSTVVPLGATPSDTLRSIRALCAAPHAPAGVWPTGVQPLAGEPTAAGGRIVTVWGPMGAPGRSTVARWLAEAHAAGGRSTLLVDADTYAPSLGLDLGIVPDSGGLLAAVRQAEAGLLTVSTLASLARRVRGPWHVLAGIPAADRWPELRPAGLDRLWEVCRSAFEVTVVDAGFCLEVDGDGPWGRQRNAATLGAVAAADHLVAVGDARASGAARLAVAWPALRAAGADVPVTIVRNRARREGADWAEALRACGVAAPIVCLPEGPESGAWGRPGGRRPGSRARRSARAGALGDLARRSVPR